MKSVQSLCAYGYFTQIHQNSSVRLPPAIQWRVFLRPRRNALLRDPLSCKTWLPLCWLQQTHHWTLHHCHVPQIPSRTLRLLILPEAAQQRHIQRAKRQTLLPCLLRQTFRLRWPRQHPKPGSFYTLGSFQFCSPLLVGQTADTTQNISFASWGNKYSPPNLGNKEKLGKQLRRMARKFYSKYNIVRHQICLSLPYLLSASLSLNQSHFLYYLPYLHYYSLYCPNPCPHGPFSCCMLCKCNHVYKKSSSPSQHSHAYSVFPCLCHLFLHSPPKNSFYQLLSCLILPTDFVISYRKLSVVFECSSYEGTSQWRNGMLAAPQCLQVQSLLEVHFLYLICILLSLKLIFLQVVLLIIGALKITNYIYCCLSQVCGANYYSNTTNIYFKLCLSVQDHFDLIID